MTFDKATADRLVDLLQRAQRAYQEAALHAGRTLYMESAQESALGDQLVRAVMAELRK